MRTGLVIPITARVDSLERFLAAVDAIPMLSSEEECELSRQFRQECSREAAQKLAVSHLPLVVGIARGYSGYGLPYADLIQEGAIGLMRAVKRFDPGRGIRLAAYAAHFIRAQIHDFVVANWRIVKTATTKAQRKLFFNLRRRKKRLGWMNDEEANEIADELDVRPRDVTEMDSRLSGYDVPLDSSYDEDYRGGGPLIPDIVDWRFDPLTDTEASEFRVWQLRRLRESLDLLDERSREILTNRWLREDKLTLKELGRKYGISKERVRQIEQRALARLRRAFES